MLCRNKIHWLALLLHKKSTTPAAQGLDDCSTVGWPTSDLGCLLHTWWSSVANVLNAIIVQGSHPCRFRRALYWLASPPDSRTRVPCTRPYRQQPTLLLIGAVPHVYVLHSKVTRRGTTPVAARQPAPSPHSLATRWSVCLWLTYGCTRHITCFGRPWCGRKPCIWPITP
jgi:hypothetical protein